MRRLAVIAASLAGSSRQRFWLALYQLWCIPLYIALLLIPAAALRGQADTRIDAKLRPPHEWTVEERIRLRFDSGSMQQRRQSDEGTEAEVAARAGRDGVNVVDGSKNPELFLPWEVFDSLLRRGFNEIPESRQLWRNAFEPKARELGINAELWPALERIAGDFLESRETQRRLLKELHAASGQRKQEIRAEIQAVQGPDCRMRAEALEEARAYFGREKFERFLYEAVAPGMKATTEGAEWESQLRVIQGGCQ